MTNNIDHDISFDLFEKSIEKTLIEPKKAFYGMQSEVLYHRKYMCQVSVVRKTQCCQLTKWKILSDTIVGNTDLLIDLQLHQIWMSPAPIFSNTVALQKNSPYKEFLNHAIINLLENGAINNLRTRMETKLWNCESTQENDESQNKQVSIKKLASLFLIVGVGFIFALILSILEFFQKTFRKQVEKRPKHQDQNIMMVEETLMLLMPKLDENLRKDTFAFLNLVNRKYNNAKML